MLPVIVPMVQANVLLMSAVKFMPVLVPVQIDLVLDVVTEGKA